MRVVDPRKVRSSSRTTPDVAQGSSTDAREPPVNRARIGVVGLVVAAAGVMAPARAADPPASRTRRRTSHRRRDGGAPGTVLSGAVGAWLVARPFQGRQVRAGDPTGGCRRGELRFAAGAVLPGERETSQRGAPARWTLNSSSDGPIDPRGAREQGQRPRRVRCRGPPCPRARSLPPRPGRGRRRARDRRRQDGCHATRRGRFAKTTTWCRSTWRPAITRTLKLHQRGAFFVRVTASNLTPVPGVHLFLPERPPTTPALGRRHGDRPERTSIPSARTTGRRFHTLPRGAAGRRTDRSARLTGKDPPALELQLGAGWSTPADADFVASLPPVTPKGSSTVLEPLIAGRQVRASFPRVR